MNVSVFGLGYVGCVTAGCLAARGHHVVGVDVSADKVAMVNAGTSPIIEPGLGELLTRVILPQAAYNGLLATAAVTLPAVWMRR